MSMDELFNKLKNDRLTPDDLRRLKSHINSSSNDELAQYLSEDTGDNACTDDDMLRRIKKRIDSRIDTDQLKARQIRRYRIALTAASILLPIFIIASAYLYFSGRDIPDGSSAMCSVSTAAGEISTVTLPDGTAVTLNGDSRLEFHADFSVKKRRQVTFHGETYFDVAKDADHPFEILAPEMTVEVLGTKFNIVAGDSGHPSSLTLESGKVALTATGSDEKVTLSPGERATLTPGSDKFSVDTAAIDGSTQWMAKELIFDDASPESIVAVIENHYGVKLNPAIKNKINENFSGTLPGGSLSETLETLSYIYGFDTSNPTVE